jgi:ABC-2 type transport system ATP-binding protein
VSLILALAKRPGLLMLDEPLAALDLVARQGFMQTVMAMAADGEVTIVLPHTSLVTSNGPAIK